MVSNVCFVNDAMNHLVRWFRENASERLNNKTAGYNRHIMHFPDLVKMQSQKMEPFFLRKKKHTFFNLFSNISNVQSFWIFFLPEQPYFEGGRDIFRKNYHLIRILQQFYHI